MLWSNNKGFKRKYHLYRWIKKHYRVKHSQNEFANGINHKGGIENFWGLCKAWIK